MEIKQAIKNMTRCSCLPPPAIFSRVKSLSPGAAGVKSEKRIHMAVFQLPILSLPALLHQGPALTLLTTLS